MFKNFINNLFSSKKDSVQKEGVVKFFNRTKGFGFITVNDTNEEIFVHKSNLIDKIRDRDHVTFGIEESDKGPTATNVKVVKK